MLLVMSDGHESIKAAASGELPGAGRARCTSNATTLAYLGAQPMGEVPEDLWVLFGSGPNKTAWPSPRSSSHSVASASRRRSRFSRRAVEQTRVKRTCQGVARSGP